MKQGKDNKKKTFVHFSDSVTAASEILSSVRKGSQSRSDINRINEEMYKDPEVFSILMRLMEKTCKPFRDGRTIKAVAENGDSICQNYINQLILDYRVEERLPRQAVSLYAKGDVMARLVSVETLETRKTVFEKEPTDEELKTVQEKISKIKNRTKLIRTIDEIENPLEYYDLQFLGETIKYLKRPIDKNDWIFGSLAKIGQSLLAISPDMIAHQILYPRLSSEKVATGEYDGYGEPIELEVALGKGLLESAYPAYVDYMLDKAANQTAKSARSIVINLVQIQCSDMGEEEKDEVVEAVLSKLTTSKSLSEKGGIGEYNNAVAEPAVVVTTKVGETGDIEATQIGGDYEAGPMTDTKFYQTVMYGAFRAIKQEFGILDDNAGFSGGETLAQIQSAETDMIETAQKALCALWEDIFNRYLQSVGMEKFVGQFRLVMNKPHTQADTDEENDRASGLQSAEQVMNAVEGKSLESLKIFRAMLNIVDIPEEVIKAIDDVIEAKEEELKKEKKDGGDEDADDDAEDFGDGLDDGLLEDVANEMDDFSPIGEDGEPTEVPEEGAGGKRERLPNFDESDYEE